MSENAIPEYCFPMLVSSIGEGDEELAAVHMWARFDKLPDEVKDVLGSDSLAHYIYNVQNEENLTAEDTEKLARYIRGFFLRDLSEQFASDKISELFVNSQDVGVRIISELKNLKTGEDTTGSSVVQGASPITTESLILKVAYEKFPQVLRQLVTTDKIITKPFLNPLSPTVKNWIAVYEKISGVKKHTAIERGDFLYRSQACKALTDKDRNKLAQLLSARDEETELTFDSEKGGILWENKAIITEQKDVSPTTTVAETKNVPPSAIESSTQQTPPVPQTGIIKTAPKTVEKTVTPTGGVVGKDGSFSPQVGRKKHGEVDLNGDPQIVTRPRMALGAAGHKKDPISSASGVEVSPVMEKPIQFVGSARNNQPEPLRSEVKTPKPEQEPTLKSFAKVSTRTADADKTAEADTSTDDLKINFSSGQTLPAEKAKVSPEKTEVPKETPDTKTPPVPKRSPFHIDPMGGR